MWVTPEKRECYGTLFPDVARLETNKPHKGEVFGCRLTSFGIGVQSVEFSVDDQKWQRCIECPHYRSCYDLSMAKLLFTHAVVART
jgi:hypothetical protein